MPSTILIVDDEPSGRDVLESILTSQDYALQMAGSGPEALRMADALHPDLILLDVMLPGMDGFEVCRRIRSMPRLAEVPIIILTALDDSDSRLLGIESGADDFLSKPVNRQELRARVRTIVRLNRYRTLLEQRESLREMAQRLVGAQEEERLRISRELHDELGQSLTAHLIGLRLLARDLPLPEAQLHTRLDGLTQEATEILERMRHLAQDLRPPAVDTLDLSAALETYCQNFSDRARLPVAYEADAIPPVPDAIAITSYRFLQEALTNVIKHAGAARSWVELALEDENIVLTVQDNGQGFDPDGANRNGIGLQGLRERLTLVGGTMTLRSAPGRGTVVTARLPFQPVEVA